MNDIDRLAEEGLVRGSARAGAGGFGAKPGLIQA